MEGNTMPPFMMQPTIRGFRLGECISALQKSIRRCDEANALTWAVEIDQSGHGAMLWNRLLIIASEDIGLAEPHLPANLRALYDNWKDARERRNPSIPERLFTLHAVMMMARAKKSRVVDNAIWATYAIEQPLVAEIPEYALDGHTARGRAKGAGSTQATNPEAFALVNVPEGLGPNPYELRKEKYRAEVGMDVSKQWFKEQGRRTDSKVAKLEADSEGLLV
jgi:replication-associated recombination protein RarA